MTIIKFYQSSDGTFIISLQLMMQFNPNYGRTKHNLLTRLSVKKNYAEFAEKVPTEKKTNQLVRPFTCSAAMKFFYDKLILNTNHRSFNGFVSNRNESNWNGRVKLPIELIALNLTIWTLYVCAEYD